MAVKKTGSPLSSGAESLEPLGGKEEIRSGKAAKSFESQLAEVAGQLEQTANLGKADSPTQTAFKKIASNANLDSPEEAMTAIRESAQFLVSSRLDEKLQTSEQGRKISEDLSKFISKDPLMHRKLLNILQRLK